MWWIFLGAGAWGQSLLVNDVLPVGGPYFERMQARVAGDPTAQLNFELELESGAADPFRLEALELTYYEGGVQVGPLVDVDVDLLRSTVLRYYDHAGYGPGLDGRSELDLPGPNEALYDGVVTATRTHAAGFATPNGLSRFLAAGFDRAGASLYATPLDFGATFYDSVATSIVASADGGQVLAGGARVATSTGGAGSSRFAVARVSPEGAPMASFSGDGWLTTSFPGCSARAEDIEELTLAGERRMLVAVGGASCGGANRLALAAYTSGGSPFVSFVGAVNAGGGTALVATTEANEVGGAAVDDARDRIYVVGQLGHDLLVARFDPAGKLDPTWGTGGLARVDPPEHRDVKGFDAQVMADGRVVVAGEGDRAGRYEMLTFRLLQDGTPDPSLAGVGWVATSFPGFDHAYGRDVQIDEAEGRISTSGFVELGRADVRFAVASHDDSGVSRAEFADDGRVTVPFPAGTGARSYGLAADGDWLVLSGQANGHLGTARLNASDGTPDDPTVFSTWSRRLLYWPDTGFPLDEVPLKTTEFDWDALPDQVVVRGALVDPEDGAFEDEWLEAFDLTPYASPVAYTFPASAFDVPPDHRWSVGQSHHLKNNHRLGAKYRDLHDRIEHSQRYAYDLGMVRWDGKAWVGHHGEEDDGTNADHLVYGRPVHPMADGEIVYCANGAYEHSAPGQDDADSQCPAPNWDYDGDGVDDGCYHGGGGNMVLIAHDDGTITMYAHLQRPLAPEICPHDLGASALANPIPVTTGTVLGLVGNSGNSSGPHLHVDRTLRDPTFEAMQEGLPLYWSDTYAIPKTSGPEAFPNTIFPQPWAHHGSSVLAIGLSNPLPETSCAAVADTPDASPDGNFGADWFCPDDEGEAVCVEDGGAGSCLACDNPDQVKPAGCTCTVDDQCAAGLECWGNEFQGGAVGRCYPPEGPPAWQCTFVCDQLFTGGWCDHDHEGFARCYDALTDGLEVDTCWLDGDDGDGLEGCLAPCGGDPQCESACAALDGVGPMHAWDGECMVQCVTDQDCADWGYPADTYVCGYPSSPECVHVSRVGMLP